ncbi:trigger factor [Peptoniphilus sp. ING2-D1G]|nr:trigger factor [Peptoniphilus sp. ING2-D1G]
MTEIKKKEKNTVFFDIVLKADELMAAEEEVFKKNRKYFQIPGFRKGKAPKKIIENVYGKDVFLEDAINDKLPEKYEKAVEEMGLEVVDQPKVDIKEAIHGQDVNVEISVDVKPEVKLGDYENLEIEDVKYEVTDELINSDLESQRKMNARIVNVDDRPAKEQDKVNIDYKGSINGEVFEGGTAQKQDLQLGSNTFIPGFEEQIIGHNTGEEFTIDVKFPEDYSSEELKGKEAQFEIKLNSISYEELPELDDEFIKDISDFNTVEEYKKDAREKREKELQERAESEKESRVLAKIVEDMEVDVPEGMVNSQIDMQMDNFDRSLKMQGMSIEQYINMIGSNVEAFRDNLRADALQQVKTSLAIEQIAREQAIEITDEEIEKEADRVVEQYFGKEEDKKAEMKESMLKANKEGLKENLANRKAIDYVMGKTTFVEPKEETDEKKETEASEEDK